MYKQITPYLDPPRDTGKHCEQNWSSFSCCTIIPQSKTNSKINLKTTHPSNINTDSLMNKSLKGPVSTTHPFVVCLVRTEKSSYSCWFLLFKIFFFFVLYIKSIKPPHTCGPPTLVFSLILGVQILFSLSFILLVLFKFSFRLCWTCEGGTDCTFTTINN